jgi:hypothetical protein
MRSPAHWTKVFVAAEPEPASPTTTSKSASTCTATEASADTDRQPSASAPAHRGPTAPDDQLLQPPSTHQQQEHHHQSSPEHAEPFQPHPSSMAKQQQQQPRTPTQQPARGFSAPVDAPLAVPSRCGKRRNGSGARGAEPGADWWPRQVT